jgi:2-amino-4-hydroxy-6-hydroxymethyldihydropteridine diphosphokinase
MSSPDSTIDSAINGAGARIVRGTIADIADESDIPVCFIGLGANLDSHSGSPEASLQAAFIELAALSDSPVVASSLWRSRPVDCPPGSPDFVNAVLAFRPRNASRPLQLLCELQQIENAFGRVRNGVQNAPRPLDLDLLLCGNLSMNTSVLVLPHPRLHLRGFVLAPLAEIAPGLVPPGQSLPVDMLLSAIGPGADLTAVKDAMGPVSL